MLPARVSRYLAEVPVPIASRSISQASGQVLGRLGCVLGHVALEAKALTSQFHIIQPQVVW